MKINVLEKLITEVQKIKANFTTVSYFTCIEISESHIKLAQFERKKGEPKIIYLFTRNIPSQDEEAIIKTLQSLLSEIKIKGKVLSCLPRHQITVRYMKLPSHKPEEIEAMLDFQISKQIPYPKDEISYSYLKIGVDSLGYTDALLAIVHRDAVFRHLNILRSCGLEPERISFDFLSTCGWFIFSFPDNRENILLIDIDTVYTKIGVISSSGQLLFSRAVKIGVEELDKDKEIFMNFVDEIKLTLSTFSKENPNISIEKIILTGAVSVLEKVKQFLKNEFSMEIDIKLPLEKISLKRNVLEENWFDMHRVSLNAVLGLGLEKDISEGLNLLPLLEKERRILEKRKYQIIFSIILIFLIFLTLFGFIYKKIHEKISLVRYLNNELKKINVKAQSLEEKKRNLELIRQLFADRGISLDILTELYKIVPPEINLVSFDFEDGKGLTLRGTSTEMASVFRFVAILDKTPYFSNSQVKFVRKRPGTENLTDFEIFSPQKEK